MGVKLWREDIHGVLIKYEIVELRSAKIANIQENLSFDILITKLIVVKVAMPCLVQSN
jgi:hypothetical protein